MTNSMKSPEEIQEFVDRISPNTDWSEFDCQSWCTEAAQLIRSLAQENTEQIMADDDLRANYRALEKQIDDLKQEVDFAFNAGIETMQSGRVHWQPIETAPKGEEVLLWATRHNPHVFLDDWARYEIHNQPRITHWMPLPQPPQEQTK